MSPHAQRIDETREKKIAQDETHRQDDLKIVRLMQRVAMMTGMARLEPLRIYPTQEGKKPAEESVHPFGLKDRAVRQFMNCDDHHRRDRSVKEYQQ